MKTLLIIVNHIDFFFSHRLYVAHMAHHTFDMHVIVAAKGAGTNERLKNFGYEGVELPVTLGGMHPRDEIQAIGAIKKIINETKPDFIHAVALKAVLHTALATRFKRNAPPTVFALTGLGYLFSAKSPKANLVRRCVELLLRIGFARKNTHVIFQNQADQNEFITKKITSSLNSTLIYGSGVNTSIFIPVKIWDEDKKNNNIKIILPARMLEDKGIETFIHAAKIIKKHHEDTRFILCGRLYPENPKALKEKTIRQWVDNGDCEWWGHCDSMVDVLQSADIVCLPSTYREGVPRALIEASSCACPIVTTDLPGCNDIVHHDLNGILVPPDDASALAIALTQLIESPELRKQYGLAGRQRVVDIFDVEHVKEKTAAIYTNLLNKLD